MLKIDAPVDEKLTEKGRLKSRSGTFSDDSSSTGSPLRQVLSSMGGPSHQPAGAADQAKADVEKQARLMVGPNIKLKGASITDCDTLVVEGHVEASMTSRVVEIAESGLYSGEATMDRAEIWGRFEGNLTVRQELVIHATGRVSGTITYRKVRIEEGGELCGEISTLAA